MDVRIIELNIESVADQASRLTFSNFNLFRTERYHLHQMPQFLDGAAAILVSDKLFTLYATLPTR